MRRIKFKNNQYYYIHNSGKKGSEIFRDKRDYIRFVFSLLHLNTNKSVGKEGNSRYLLNPNYQGSVPVAGDGERLVSVGAYSLLSTSFHIIAKQVRDKGVSRFMQKLGTGYAGYFNSKYNHKGRLFDGTYDAMEIEGADHLLAMTRYVHLLPVSQELPGWHVNGIEDWDKALKMLADYPWSSYLDYAGDRNTVVVNEGDVLSHKADNFDYRAYMREWEPA